MNTVQKRFRSKASGRIRRARTAPLKPLSRPNLVAEVVGQLRRQILAGAFADGTLPPEGRLAQSLGVSRTVIREAMRGLRVQGLVEVSQGCRPRVKPVDTRAAADSLDALLQRGVGSLSDLMEIRRTLETRIAALAAQRATTDDKQRLGDVILELTAARTVADQVEADVRFHDELAKATGNPIYVLLLDAIGHLLRESRRRSIAHSGVGPALEGHRQILAAVEKGRPHAAERAMLEHLEMAERDLQEAGE